MRQDDVCNDAAQPEIKMFEKNFVMEFILHSYGASIQALTNSLTEFAEDIRIAPIEPGVADNGNDFLVNLRAQDPTSIFDICSQFGRIRRAKIEEKEL